MRSIESDWWLMDLPDEWEAEQDEETIVLSDQDGVGVLEITALQTQDLEAVDLQTIAGDLVPQGLKSTPARLAGLNALYFQYIDEDSAVRDWIAGNEHLVLLVTYSCATEHQGLDDALIDEVLETLELKTLPGDMP